jgi:hypothetical protein
MILVHKEYLIPTLEVLSIEYGDYIQDDFGIRCIAKYTPEGVLKKYYYKAYTRHLEGYSALKQSTDGVHTNAAVSTLPSGQIDAYYFDIVDVDFYDNIHDAIKRDFDKTPDANFINRYDSIGIKYDHMFNSQRKYYTIIKPHVSEFIKELKGQFGEELSTSLDVMGTSNLEYIIYCDKGDKQIMYMGTKLKWG